MNYFKTLATLSAMSFALCAGAQSDSPAEHWHIGLSGGFNVSSMRFSDIDSHLFPENKSNFSGVFSPFVEYQFGHENCFAVRAQLAFLTRGGHLSDIGRGYFDDYLPGDEGEVWLDDVRYGLKATYFDIRVPLIYQIGKDSWRFRPYVYVAPVLGFVTGGHTDARFVMTDDSYDGVRYDLTKANMKGTWFAGALGVGAKYNFDIAGCPFYLGLDLSYQLGFTDTYGSPEKDGDVDHVVSFFPTGKKVEGTRKLSGFEMQACVGIPFSVFRKKAPAPVVVPEPVVEEVVEVVEQPAPVVEEIPCYTLDMIMLMMSRGQSVAGKTICAVDDVNFDLNKAVIKPSSYDYLDKLADILVRTGSDIVVKGHTDNTGTPELNMDLSRRRAETVTDYLISKGVSASKISFEYFGETLPLTTNDTEDGRRLNRRVEFEILN